MINAGLGFSCRAYRAAADDGATAAKYISARQPEQISKSAAVGMPGAINAFRVHLVILLEPRKDGIKEFQIAISLITNRRLPAGFLSLVDR